MRITDALLGEHAVFYAQFAHLESEAEGNTLASLKEKVALLTAALASHAGLEDELLFDSLDDADAETGVFAVMREQHRAIETGLLEIQRMTDPARARTLLDDVLQLTRDHFASEEQVAFPLAEASLGEAGLERAGAEWARRRGVLLHESPTGIRERG